MAALAAPMWLSNQRFDSSSTRCHACRFDSVDEWLGSFLRPTASPGLPATGATKIVGNKSFRDAIKPPDLEQGNIVQKHDVSITGLAIFISGRMRGRRWHLQRWNKATLNGRPGPSSFCDASFSLLLVAGRYDRRTDSPDSARCARSQRPSTGDFRCWRGPLFTPSKLVFFNEGSRTLLRRSGRPRRCAISLVDRPMRLNSTPSYRLFFIEFVLPRFIARVGSGGPKLYIFIFDVIIQPTSREPLEYHDVFRC